MGTGRRAFGGIRTIDCCLPMSFAYIANGKLFASVGGEKAKEIESAFARQAEERHRQSQERNQWKRGSGGDGMASYGLWGNAAPVEGSLPIRIVSAAYVAEERRLLYTLTTGAVGGLFSYDLEAGEERRIFHKEDLVISDLDFSRARGELVCAVSDGEGMSLALCDADRYRLRPVTEGDSVDAAPSWVGDGSGRVVYQSAGVARNQAGEVFGLGPSAVWVLDLERGESEALLEDDRFDYLAPRMDADGNVYCIRRPYYAEGRRYSQWDSFKDFALVPFRLIKAGFGFLNAFSQIFGKQSLVNATTGKRREVDNRTVFLKGRLIEIGRESKSVEAEGYAPRDWELIRVDAEGEVEVIRNRVSDFAIDAEGKVLCTNGSAVFGAKGEAVAELSAKSVVERVVAL